MSILHSNLTDRSSKSLDHERENRLITLGIEVGLLADTSKALVDDAHADEYHHENEQAEYDRTDGRRCCTQLMGIALHQHHFEEHLSGAQQTGAVRQCAHEQEIEEREKRAEHHREYRRERQQISNENVLEKPRGRCSATGVVVPHTDVVQQS